MKLKEGMFLKDKQGWIWEVFYDEKEKKFFFVTISPFPLFEGDEDELRWKEWEILDDETTRNIKEILGKYETYENINPKELYEKIKEVLK